MLSLFLFVLALVFAFITLRNNKEWIPTNRELTARRFADHLLAYMLLLNVGIMFIFSSILHIFWGPETARMIGWPPGNPFQFEVGVADFTFGILGLLSFWIRGRFWDATVLAASIFLLGCFIGHTIDYAMYGNDAPWNFGFFIWFTDLFIPIVLLLLWIYVRRFWIQDRKVY